MVAVRPALRGGSDTGVDGNGKGSKAPGNTGKGKGVLSSRRQNLGDPETGRAEEPGPLLSVNHAVPLPALEPQAALPCCPS